MATIITPPREGAAMSRPVSAERTAPAPSAARSPFELTDYRLTLRDDCTLADVERACDLARRLWPFARTSYQRYRERCGEGAEVWQGIQDAQRSFEDASARRLAPILLADIDAERKRIEKISEKLSRPFPTDAASLRQNIDRNRGNRFASASNALSRCRDIEAPRVEEHFQARHWARLLAAGLTSPCGWIADIELAVECLETAAAPRAAKKESKR